MLCFSYNFFVNSFNSQYLVKSVIIFFFQILYKFNFNILYIMFQLISYSVVGWNTYLIHGIHNIQRIMYSLRTLVIFIMVFIDLLYCLLKSMYIYFIEILDIYNILIKYLIYLSTSNIYILNLYFMYKLLYLVILLKNKFHSYGTMFAFPIKRSITTLLKSPHVHKKARDQYMHITHKHFITVPISPVRYFFFSIDSIQQATCIAVKIESVICSNLFY